MNVVVNLLSDGQTYSCFGDAFALDNNLAEGTGQARR